MRSWLTGRTTASSALSLNALDEPQALENALHAASHIMNDDIETAETELSQGSSSFHFLGLGLVGFMRAVLGFEKEMMAEASKRLNEAETKAYNSYRTSLRHQNESQASIYSPGSEYLLCQAEVQIMGAVIGVLTESVTESIKGFYKLRKAFLTLDAILEEEKSFLAKMKSKNATTATFDPTPPGTATGEKITESTSISSSALDTPTTGTESDTDEFFDVAEAPSEIPLAVKRASTIKSSSSKLADDLDGLTMKDQNSERPQRMRRLSSQIQEGPDAELFSNYVDAFVHSSSNMCYGMLLLLLSLLPPAFGPLIRIAGFKGDRKRGIALLWQASKFGNLNGAFAGLILLGYYNGFIGFCDILPATGSGAYPEERCQELLQTSRKRFPKSCLWMIEETRVISNKKNIDGGIEMLEKMPESPLQQVRALHCFEMAMNYLFVHRYDDCSIAFHKMIALNNWSHGLYYYISACCHVELYREFLPIDPKKAAEQADKVGALLKKIPNHIGKKKIMARQLPFDVFVQRKLDKWNQRAKDHNIAIVDAIGVSPVCEMIYFWNGFKRMNQEQLQHCRAKLEWSTKESKIPWASEAIDEKGIKSLLTGVVLRHMGKTQEAREVLQEEIMKHPNILFKNNNRDDWTPPAARYETAVTYWVDHLQTGEAKDLDEAQKLLDVAAAWGAYDLDVRVGLRVKTGLETVKRQKEGTA